MQQGNEVVFEGDGVERRAYCESGPSDQSVKLENVLLREAAGPL